MCTTAKLAGVALCEGIGSSCPVHWLSFASSPSWFIVVHHLECNIFSVD